MKSMSLAALITLTSGGVAGQCESSKAACTSGTTAVTVAYSEPTKNIVETAVGAGSFTTLVAAVQAAGLAETLTSGSFTVFAPTDEAFAALPEGTVESLLKPENLPTLRAILLYHVVAGDVRAADAAALDSAETLNGQRIDISADGGSVRIDDAGVIMADVLATNGVIHVIDRVLMPSTNDIIATAVEAGSFSTLAAAINAAGLAEALKGEGPFTVFAPTDEAFAALPKGTVESLLKKENLATLQQILKLHVVSGRVFSGTAVEMGQAESLLGKILTVTVENGQAMVNGARIVSTDIDASNGVIHVIDGVLMPE